jgi:voltage-gated potassium channel
MKSSLKRITKEYFLLFSILVFIFGPALFHFSASQGVLNLTVYTLLFIGIYVSIESKSLWIRLAPLAGLASNILLYFLSDKTLSIVFFSFSALIFVGITFRLLRQIAMTGRVTPMVIVEAINGYLLIGVVSVVLHSLVLIIDPEAIGFATKPELTDIIYYSFITLTTIGYGDVSPVGPVARQIAVFIGLAGQLYLAIIIALIVGKVSNLKNQENQ